MICIARMESSKRPLDFVRIAKLVNLHIKADFLWVGDGPLLHQMRQLIDSQNLKCVEFLGKVNEFNKDKLLRESSALASTSQMEGFSLTPGEAFLRMVPVVVYDLPIYSEIYNGFPVKAKCFDFKEFALKLTEILENPDSTRRTVEKAKRYVETNYSYTAIGSKATAALEKFIN